MELFPLTDDERALFSDPEYFCNRKERENRLFVTSICTKDSWIIEKHRVFVLLRHRHASDASYHQHARVTAVWQCLVEIKNHDAYRLSKRQKENQ